MLLHTTRIDGWPKARKLVRTAVLISGLLLAVLLAAASAAGCGGSQTSTAAGTADGVSGEGRLKIDEASYDFGDVAVGQFVEHEFAISNTGAGTLRIGDIDVKRLEGC